MQAPFCFLQAGVLRSQPSVPVIALTGDTQVCAFLKRLASEKMLLDQQRLCTGFRCKLGVAILSGRRCGREGC